VEGRLYQFMPRIDHLDQPWTQQVILFRPALSMLPGEPKLQGEKARNATCRLSVRALCARRSLRHH